MKFKEGIMAKTLIIYFSKYGSTKKYAELISSELNADIYSIKNVNISDLINYDTIILGSGLYAGKIQGINIIIDNFEKIQDKKIVLFTCGLADYKNVENVNNIHKRLVKIIPENIMQNIKVYYLQGGINYKKLNMKHKLMMWLLKILTMRNKNMNGEDKEFIETYGKTLDFTCKENIIELVKYCK
jgi:menaquinone-dependent protoporphyrinogen IX oxidase